MINLWCCGSVETRIVTCCQKRDTLLCTLGPVSVFISCCHPNREGFIICLWDGETCQTKLREFIDEIFLEAGLCHSMTEWKTPVTGQRAARIAFVSARCYSVASRPFAECRLTVCIDMWSFPKPSELPTAPLRQVIIDTKSVLNCRKLTKILIKMIHFGQNCWEKGGEMNKSTESYALCSSFTNLNQYFPHLFSSENCIITTIIVI